MMQRNYWTNDKYLASGFALRYLKEQKKNWKEHEEIKRTIEKQWFILSKSTSHHYLLRYVYSSLCMYRINFMCKHESGSLYLPPQNVFSPSRLQKGQVVFCLAGSHIYSRAHTKASIVRWIRWNIWKSRMNKRGKVITQWTTESHIYQSTKGIKCDFLGLFSYFSSPVIF